MKTSESLAIDKDPVSVIDYYGTRYGELDDKVITDVRKPSNILRENHPLIGHPITMSRQTIRFHCKELIRERLIEYNKDTARYWVPDRVKQEIRYFGVWFGEVAISRLFMSATNDRVHKQDWGIYGLYIHRSLWHPLRPRKPKDKDMLAEEWVESAMPVKTIFWRFLQSFRGLEVVRPENKDRPAYETDSDKINELETALKKLQPKIFKSLSDTKYYMGIDRNKESLSRQRPSRV